MRILVGGVSELFQSDLDVGRLAVERLLEESWGGHVIIEELHYGAVAVTQRLEDLSPDVLVLVSAVRRGRPPGTVQRRAVEPPVLTPEELQAAVGDAVTGYVHVDLIVDVATGLGVLPPRTLTIELEPQRTGPGEGLSALAEAGLEVALDLVRAELRRAPLLWLVEDLRPLLEDERLEPSASRDVLRRLVRELHLLDVEGRWGRTFGLRDELRLGIAGHLSSVGMDHRDWALWWGLIEELDRLEVMEAAGP